MKRKPKIFRKNSTKEQELSFCSRSHGGKSLYHKKKSLTEKMLKKIEKVKLEK